MAGRIQLTTRGVQDVYFTDNPDYSYFVQLFRKHTNYTTQFVKLDVDNDVEFGKTVSVTIPKDQGDLVKTISLEIELDKIVGADSTRIGYVESIGHAMIEYVDMYIGDEKVQHIPSDYLQIYSEQNYTQSKQKALEKLIGKYPDRTSDVPVSSGVILGHLGPATQTRKLFIDIPFYFYRKPELAIPLCAMCFQEIRIEIKFRDLKDCLVQTDPPTDTSLQTTTLDFDLISNEILSSNVVVTSSDGSNVATNVNSEIMIPGKTIFNGVGVVSPAMNIIVTSGNIYRYENDLWSTRVGEASLNLGNTIQFSDDGNVIIEVGTGIWVWNGTRYIFTSNTNIIALSRDGNFYCVEGSGLRLEIFNITTGTRLGGFFSKAANIAVSQAHLSHDGTKLLIVLNDIVYVYQYTTDWFRYGQNVTLFESGILTYVKDGNSFFVYNRNEEYNHPNVATGVGRVYVYDTTTTQWTEVHRYKGSNGTYASMSDDKLKLHIKRSVNETDVITLKELTRTVEGYDEVVIQSVENIVDAGSNVYGAGYQSLISQVQETIAFNTNTSYSPNINTQLPTDLNDTIISNNGLIRVDHYTLGNQVRVYKINSVSSGFFVPLEIIEAPSSLTSPGGAPRDKLDLDISGNVFSKFSISKSGRYFAVQDHINNQVLVYEIFNEFYRNIQYEEGTLDPGPNIWSQLPVPNILTNTQFMPLPSSLEGLKFSDDETSFTMYGGNTIKTFLISNPTSAATTVTENDFNHPVMVVSKDINRFIKHDPSTNIIKIFTINSDGTLVSSLPINLPSTPLAFELSKDGILAAVVTDSFTYIYSYDGKGWKQKSSLFVGIQTFKKFYMIDDGNTLIYIKSESPVNRTLVEVYTYNNNVWSRIHEENDNSTIGGEGIGDVSLNGHHIASIFNAVSNRTNLRLKRISTQQLSVVVGVDKDISQVYPKQILSCKLSLEMVFLDKYERAIVKNTKKDYVITQIQHNRFLAPKEFQTHKFRTNFLNPVKELFFVIKRENKQEYLDFVSPFDYDNDTITSENKLIFYENLKSLEFNLNDTQVLDEDTGNFAFLKAIQPAIHHSKTPLIRRFYTYSFACEPEQHFPTGQVNFSLVNNQLMTFKLTQNTTSNRNIDIYALSYNILRLDKGMMRVMFNTT
jgi:hypothetical protein